MSKYDTIKDADGDVYSGKVVSTVHEPVGGFVGAVLSGGLTLLSDNPAQVTVEVNGERHTGTSIKSR